jgi:methionine-rich copper-binding protein CopC
MIQRLLCAAAGAVFLLTASAAGASAHDALVSSNPSAEAQVDVAPEQVQLVFTEPPLGVGTQLEVTSPDGDLVSVDAARTVDTTVTQPLAGDLPAGTYRVRWRVTSSDGHPISGEYTFTATTGAGGATAPTEPPTATPAPVQTTATSPATVAAPDDAPASSNSGLGGVAVAIVAVALLAAAVARVTRHRRRPN